MYTFRKIQSKENKKLNAVFGSIAFGLLIAAVYLTLSGHNMAVKINLWQGKVMGDDKYFPVLTIFFLALPPLLLLLLVKVVVLKLQKK
ncbi:hypothetical protein [Ferruginibacter sp.]|nr:hypothetical protein [Ferruginibacter sp.]